MHGPESSIPSFPRRARAAYDEGVVANRQFHFVTEMELVEPHLGESYPPRIADSNEPGAYGLLHVGIAFPGMQLNCIPCLKKATAGLPQLLPPNSTQAIARPFQCSDNEACHSGYSRSSIIRAAFNTRTMHYG